MSENVRFIFKRALGHYVKVLEKLKDDEEIEFSNDIFRQDIQNTIEKSNKMILGLDSADLKTTLDRNRELMYCSLKNYISDLEKMKEIIKTKLQNPDSSLPPIKFNNVNDEIEVAKRISINTFFSERYLL